MNGSLALHVALALHGNAWLANPAGEPPALEASSSTFQYVRSFTAAGATSTAAWFALLRAEGVRRLELGCSEPRSAFDVGRTAFAGVDPWALVGGVRVWSATMTHVEGAREGGREGAREGERERPWAVEVREFASGPPVARPTVAEAHAQMRAALTAATAVAQHHRWNTWSGWFGQAGLQLESRAPQPRFHPDLAPAGALDLERRRLLAAAVGAWVFGGMGSWNDASLPDAAAQAEYEQATVALYRACTTALMAVVNA